MMMIRDLHTYQPKIINRSVLNATHKLNCLFDRMETLTQSPPMPNILDLLFRK